MKKLIKTTLMFALTAAIAGTTGIANADADRGEEPTSPAMWVAVYSRNAEGAMSFIGEQVTHGEPVKFTRELIYPVAVVNGTKEACDAYKGQWSISISNVRRAIADSTAFDVNIEGNSPGGWQGQAIVYAMTGTGSRTATVHWLDGRDYVITIHPIAS